MQQHGANVRESRIAIMLADADADSLPSPADVIDTLISASADNPENRSNPDDVTESARARAE